MYDRFRAIASAGAIAFVLAGVAHSQTHPLTTFFGGAAHDRVQGCAIDATGRVLITGNTGSTNFGGVLPASKAGYQKSFKGTSDAFVAVLSPDLKSVVAWTYLGGSGEDRGYGIAADAQGRVWVVGFTESANFPRTTGPAHQGMKDAFIARFSPDLKQLQMARFVGGSDDENVRGSFALDAQGNLYIGGSTGSDDFPTTAGVVQPKHAADGPGTWDGFVAKLNANGQLVWATYLGGNGEDATHSGMALASDGSVIVGGISNSSNYPTTPGAYQTVYGGGVSTDPHTRGDGIVSALAPDGKSLRFSTYVGGSHDDRIAGNDAVALDPSGDIVVIGQTQSHDLTMPAGGWDVVRTPGTNRDGFVITLAANGKSLRNGTFIGGHGDEELSGLDVDVDGNVYVSGNTDSTGYPVTLDAKQAIYAGNVDGVISKFSFGLGELLYSTYVGGSGNTGYGDRGRTLVLNGQNSVVLSGDTDSPNFPVTNGTYDTGYNGGNSDGFVTEVSLGETYPVGQGKKTSQQKLATLSWTGSPDQSSGVFSVQVKNALPNARGDLLWGPSIAAKPFKGGTLYPDAPIQRLPGVKTDASGFASYSIAMPLSIVGETRVYQFLFEDVAQTDGSRTAMSNALKVVFLP